MEKSMPGERWKNVEFDFEYDNDNRLEVSNFGRIRSFNRLSDGNILQGSMINGYKIIRLKFFAERDEAAERKFIYHNKQIAKFTLKIRQMKREKVSKKAIAEASTLLNGLRANQRKKLAADWKSRATHYHSLVHKLVADYFLKKTSENQTIVAHLDYNKLNKDRKSVV